MTDRVPVNPYADAVSQCARTLIFNGLTTALTEDQWMPLSERMRVSEAIYETLRSGGIEIRLEDGLAKLAQAASADRTDREAPTSTPAVPDA